MAGIRFWISSLIAICLFAGSTARAADYSPPPSQPCCASWSTPQWDGFYFGGQIGYSILTSDFSDAIPSATLSNSVDTTGTSYGGFVGYNTTFWDPQLVLGMELAYNWVSSLEAFTTDGVATASYKLKDYLAWRGRAGYAFGAFLPYGLVGVAVGRVDYSTGSVTNGFISGQSNVYPVGFVWGLGMDVSLTPNVFLRGEWEQTIFSPEAGIRSRINTARAGIGVRF